MSEERDDGKKCRRGERVVGAQGPHGMPEDRVPRALERLAPLSPARSPLHRAALRRQVALKKALVLVTVIASTFVAAPHALAEGALRQGKWEVTTQMEMPGMPMQLPATIRTQCVTQAHEDDPASTLPNGSDTKAGRRHPQGGRVDALPGNRR